MQQHHDRATVNAGLQVGDVLAVQADLPLRNRHRHPYAAAGSAPGSPA